MMVSPPSRVPLIVEVRFRLSRSAPSRPPRDSHGMCRTVFGGDEPAPALIGTEPIPTMPSMARRSALWVTGVPSLQLPNVLRYEIALPPARIAAIHHLQSPRTTNPAQ